MSCVYHMQFRASSGKFMSAFIRIVSFYLSLYRLFVKKNWKSEYIAPDLYCLCDKQLSVALL
jgi:hypothetical protein